MIWQCTFIWRGLIEALVVLDALRKRSVWMRRAATTRSRMFFGFLATAVVRRAFAKIHERHIHMDVDPIKQEPGDALPVFVDLA